MAAVRALFVLLGILCIGSVAAVLDKIVVPSGVCTEPSTTYLQANSKTVGLGVLNPSFPNVAHVQSEDTVTIECVTPLVTADYAKMIKGDVGTEDLVYWGPNQTAATRNVPLYPGAGPHYITGPTAVCGAQPGDVLKVEILSLSPRKNPSNGKCYGGNLQNGPYLPGRALNADGTNMSSTNVSTVIFEVDMDEYGGWGTPLYGYYNPAVLSPSGTTESGSVVPHKVNYGTKSTASQNGFDPVTYPVGFQSSLNQSTDIQYMDAGFNWRIPVRPFLGTIGVTPSNAVNYLKGAPNGTRGAATWAPSRFGGNMDNWRVGAGSTLYVRVEIPDAGFFLGDCHAAQGDSEISGTAIEASLNGVYRFTILPAATLPTALKNLSYPILETADAINIQGFAVNNYLDELPVPSAVATSGGASVDRALAHAYENTRDFLVKGFGMQEREALSLISTGVDFGVTEVVDQNFGVNANIRKSIFSAKSAAGTGGIFTGPASRKLKAKDTEGEEAMDLVSLLRRFEK